MKKSAPMDTYIELILSSEEMDFIKWIAKRDKVTIHEEMQMMFYTELRACRELYETEMKGE